MLILFHSLESGVAGNPCLTVCFFDLSSLALDSQKF